MDSNLVTKDHPVSAQNRINVPDFLLVPLVEAAFAVIKKNEESEIPSALRRISHFDSKAISNSTARTQIIHSIMNNENFEELVADEFFKRVEVSVAYSQWNPKRAEEIIKESASRDDLALLASILWIKRPENYSYGLGMIVALSSISMMETEQREAQRAEQLKLTHLENSYNKEKNKAELLASDVSRIEGELREERKTRRVREQRLEAQIASLQKQVDSNEEVTLRLKEAKDRVNSRLEQEASRAHELEKRLKIAQNEASSKTEKINQLQDQLARALSSEMELTYEDLQNLILAQKNADEISATILKIMNKTRSILSQSPISGNQEPVSEIKSSESSSSNIETPVSSGSTSARSNLKRMAVEIPKGLTIDSPEALKTVFQQKDLVVLIDGYNVSLNSFSDLSLELQRERIVSCASSIESRFRPSCVIVFDGQSQGTRGRIQSKVHVVFSPAGVTADDVIIERIRVTPNDRPILVVTSDRNLAARAKGLGCETVSSQSFVSLAK